MVFCAVEDIDSLKSNLKTYFTFLKVLGVWKMPICLYFGLIYPHVGDFIHNTECVTRNICAERIIWLNMFVANWNKAS